jgi:hypothetical protein
MQNIKVVVLSNLEIGIRSLVRIPVSSEACSSVILPGERLVSVRMPFLINSEMRIINNAVIVSVAASNVSQKAPMVFPPKAHREETLTLEIRCVGKAGKKRICFSLQFLLREESCRHCFSDELAMRVDVLRLLRRLGKAGLLLLHPAIVESALRNKTKDDPQSQQSDIMSNASFHDSFFFVGF